MVKFVLFYEQTCLFYTENNNGKTKYIKMWTLIESGKIYIGSAVNLSGRVYKYFSPSELKRAHNYIYRTLLFHEHSSFSLAILEYIDI